MENQAAQAELENMISALELVVYSYNSNPQLTNADKRPHIANVERRLDVLRYSWLILQIRSSNNENFLCPTNGISKNTHLLDLCHAARHKRI